jgi:uncharacterized protein (DUF362 family)
MSEIAKIKIEESLGLKEVIKKAVEQIGGFGKFINKGETVLLKPNFNTADPYPASSDPRFLQAIIQLVYQEGAGQVIIGDSCTMALDTRKVMEKLGIFELQNLSPPPKIIVFEEGKWVRNEIPTGKYLKNASLPEILQKIDRLILLPCLKTHFIAQFTGSLKISVGFMKPTERIRLHMSHTQEKIAELNTLIKPDLIIMDARKCFIAGGPSEGRLAEPGLILASLSRIAIDEEGIKIIQGFEKNCLGNINPRKLPQIKRAIELGIK